MSAYFLYGILFCDTFSIFSGPYKFCLIKLPNSTKFELPVDLYTWFDVWISTIQPILTTGNIYINLFSCAWLLYIIAHIVLIRYTDLEENLIAKLAGDSIRKNEDRQALKDSLFYLSPGLSLFVFIPFAYFHSNDIKNFDQVPILIKFSATASIALLAGIFLHLPLIGPFLFKFFFKNRPVSKRRELLFSRLIEKIGDAKDYMRQEESLILEFKTSFQTPYPNDPKKVTLENGQSYFIMGDDKRRYNSRKEIEKKLQDMVLEAIVGFLNASGGKLVIGINERNNKKTVIGISFENFTSEDEYQRHVIQQIINRIGKNFMGEYIDTNFENIEGKPIFVISVKPFIPVKGQIPALLDGLKCFKRTGPRTDPIDGGKEFAQFVIDRASLAN
jgi:hypothetical protein